MTQEIGHLWISLFSETCLAYLCKTANEARYLPGTLESLRADEAQIVILDSSEIYSKYTPYSYIEDMKEFIDRISQLNRAAWEAWLQRLTTIWLLFWKIDKNLRNYCTATVLLVSPFSLKFVQNRWKHCKYRDFPLYVRKLRPVD